jgi:hypothetical protein
MTPTEGSLIPGSVPLPGDLANDLGAYVATLPPGKPIFPLQIDKGAPMLRRDLEAAGILYRGAAGLVFDFHSLRCEMATLAEAAGVSPRVVRRVMRHSTLELTGRYTRPRAVYIEAAAAKLTSLRPEADQPEAAAMTCTDARPILLDATQNATADSTDRRKSNTGDGTRTHDLRIMRPHPENPNAPKDNDLRQEMKAVSHHFPTDVTQMDTGLVAVIEAWDRLPDALRAGIVAIVKAART